MPSQRKRIGFLPSEEVQNIIDKICRDNKYSQSKVTGLLVEEALRSRGFFNSSCNEYNLESKNKTISKKQDTPLRKTENSDNFELYNFNNKYHEEDMKMITEFIEFKFFKKVMNSNKNINEELVSHYYEYLSDYLLIIFYVFKQ